MHTRLHTDRQRRSHRTRGSAGGFTLIELLVVVSIIALLISVLLPSLSKARAQAKRTLCATNLHQLCQALYLYAGEARADHMPWNETMSAYYWTVWSRDTLGRPDNDVPAWKGQLYSYVPNQRVLECPADNGDRHPGISSPVWRKKLFDYWRSSYIYNARDNLTTYPDSVIGSIPAASITQLQRISNLILCGDSTIYAHGRPDKTTAWGRFLWHDLNEPWCNVGFADSHVAYLKMDPNAPEDVLKVPRKPTKRRTSTVGKGFVFSNPPTDSWLK
jgi:prepilin-type N-terminal cleavage/methylation domain-containing protein